MTSRRMDSIPLLILMLTTFLFAVACSKPGDNAARLTDKSATANAHGATAGGDTTNSGEIARSESPYELQFIDTMTRHHLDAIEVGQEAGRRARHPELKECAAKLATGHERQVTLLTGWRDKWYADAANALNFGLAGMTRMNKASLDSVSDEEFDLAFIDLMIPHHQGGIVMAKEAFARVEHGELKALSQQLIDVQQQEIDRLSRFRAAWGGGQ